MTKQSGGLGIYDSLCCLQAILKFNISVSCGREKDSLSKYLLHSRIICARYLVKSVYGSIVPSRTKRIIGIK